MGVTIQGGYDFQAKELTPASITITRDLHCWQMSFAWVPFGHYQSWSFNIGVKAASPRRPEIRQKPEHVRQPVLIFRVVPFYPRNIKIL